MYHLGLLLIESFHGLLFHLLQAHGLSCFLKVEGGKELEAVVKSEDTSSCHLVLFVKE